MEKMSDVMNDVNDMSKEEMMEFVKMMKAENARLLEKVENKKGNGRKEEVLGLIREYGKISIKDMAEKIGITDRNISSQLSYLRKDGLRFGKDSKGRIYEEKE